MSLLQDDWFSEIDTAHLVRLLIRIEEQQCN